MAVPDSNFLSTGIFGNFSAHRMRRVERILVKKKRGGWQDERYVSFLIAKTNAIADLFRMIRTKLILCSLLMFLFVEGVAQYPFREEIEAFKKQDAISPPKSGSILFVGSSSFRFWKSMEKDFSEYDVINRGFGGSTLRDVLHYVDDIVLPYNPRQVVIYCGENDLDGGTPVDTVVVRFKTLFSLIRKQNPDAHIVFVSIKPSPSRQKSTPAFISANEKIQSFLSEERNTAYVDVFSLMVDKKGEPRKELFIQDMLHMNSKGYVIWTKAIQPHLLKR